MRIHEGAPPGNWLLVQQVKVEFCRRFPIKSLLEQTSVRFADGCILIGFSKGSWLIKEEFIVPVMGRGPREIVDEVVWLAVEKCTR